MGSLNGRMKQKVGGRFRIGRGKRQDEKEQGILMNGRGGSNSACGKLNLE